MIQPSPSTEIRLQKVIARSGVTSRRNAETLMKQGRVTVNGKTVTTMGTRVDPKRDHIKVNGRHLKPPPPDVFLMVNKPAGYVSTMKDPEHRPTITDLLDKKSVRTFPVGRLDYDSEGLLLLTNNGAVAQACLHPRYHVDQNVPGKSEGGHLDPEQAVRKLERGLMPWKTDSPLPLASEKVRKVPEANSWVELTIVEGRQSPSQTHAGSRWASLSSKLKRTKFGPLTLGNLPLGNSRHLTDREANALRDLLYQPREFITAAPTSKRAGWAKSTKKPSTKPRTRLSQQNKSKKRQRRE